MRHIKMPIAWAVLTAGVGPICVSSSVQAEDSFFEALTGGDVSFSARPRYESVKQDNSLKDADAFTVRTTLAYKTNDFKGFTGFIELEDVSDFGQDNYNSTTNGHTDYSTVADPDGVEVNQAYLRFNSLDTEIKVGRQKIVYRGVPFNRFIGNVAWRQNQQSFDAISIANHRFENTLIHYAYIDQIHTIFGHGRTAGIINKGDIEMDSHLINVQYDGFPFGKIESYGYFFDYTDAPKKSIKTLGARLSGTQEINDDFAVIYTAEWAKQDGYKEGTMDKQNYYLTELGGQYGGWSAKVSYEVQQGDGTDSFKTPLGTNHPYQGWSDQFLSTPANGLKDTYYTIVGKLFGAKLVTIYHDFETDKGHLDAGSEINLLMQKTFAKHYTLGVAYADYHADKEYGGVDTEKFWLYGQVKF